MTCGKSWLLAFVGVKLDESLVNCTLTLTSGAISCESGIRTRQVDSGTVTTKPE